MSGTSSARLWQRSPVRWGASRVAVPRSLRSLAQQPASLRSASAWTLASLALARPAYSKSSSPGRPRAGVPCTDPRTRLHLLSTDCGALFLYDQPLDIAQARRIAEADQALADHCPRLVILDPARLPSLPFPRRRIRSSMSSHPQTAAPARAIRCRGSRGTTLGSLVRVAFPSSVPSKQSLKQLLKLSFSWVVRVENAGNRLA